MSLVLHEAVQVNTARVTDDGMLMVCLCECDGLCGNGGSIPLKNLTMMLEGYLNAHGGQGKLQIMLHWQDEKGEWVPMRENG